jgi:murein DD-endopeptidase MepM/ murein hydrolase activator NlpD
VFAAAVAVVSLAACERAVMRLEDSAKTDADTSSAIRVDSAAGTVVDIDSVVAAEIAERAAPEVAERAAAPTRARVRGDTTPIEPTSAELRDLAGRLVVPVDGVTPDELVNSYDEPRGDGTRSHEALDILAPRGTPVYSATDGRLLRLYESEAGGLMVYAADATDRFVLMYAHLDAYAPGLVEGAPLRRLQLIGFVGTTGNAPPNTPHLHFAISRGRPSESWWRGVPVNPYPLLAGDSSSTGR